MWYLCIIKKKDRYYTSITTDLNNRLHQHGNPPLLYKEAFPDKLRAARREREIKGWSKAKKEQLVAKLSRGVYTECNEVSPTRGVPGVAKSRI